MRSTPPRAGNTPAKLLGACMIRAQEFSVGKLPGPLLDLDLTPNGGWIGVVGQSKRRRFFFSGQECTMPEGIAYPITRAMDDSTAALVDSRTRDGMRNGWVVSFPGGVQANFYAGDAVEDVLASPHNIVVTFFDESAVSSRLPERERVAVFDSRGNFQWGYASQFPDAVDVFDCYAACWAGRHKVIFFPYTEFQLVELDLSAKQQQVWRTPPELAGAAAITSSEESFFFYGAYKQPRTFYRWRPGEDTATAIGEHTGGKYGPTVQLRGLSGGRFLWVQEDRYSIYSVA